MTGVVVLLCIVGVAWWRASLHRHPNRTCSACGGKGEIFGRFLGVVRGPCTRCRGTGKVPRRGGRSPLG